MSTELVKTLEQQGIAVPVTQDINWSSGFSDTADFVIPRLALMQAATESVKQGKANMGDIVEASELKVIAKRGEKIELIPLKAENRYVHYVEQNGKFEYAGVQSFVPGFPSGKWKWEPIEGGIKHKWVRQLAVHVLFAKDLDALPHVITLKGMGVFSAKKLISFFMTCDAEKKPCAKSVFEFWSELKTFEDNSAFAYECKMARASTDEEFAKASYWRGILSSARVQEANDVDQEVPF